MILLPTICSIVSPGLAAAHLIMHLSLSLATIIHSQFNLVDLQK